jgi:hypothetical protein
MDCELTARTIMRKLAPAVVYVLLRKNRLTEVSRIISGGWKIGHLYVELEIVGCHHCIIERKQGVVEITDSFINFRDMETRIIINFNELITRLSDVDYVTLFNPPKDYLNQWNGRISKIYLEAIF